MAPLSPCLTRPGSYPAPAQGTNLHHFIFLLDLCNPWGYIGYVIKSFKHKGLEEFFNTGSNKGIQPAQAPKLERILDRLAASKKLLDMNLPGFKLHELSGKKAGTWAVSISGNWRVTFEFEGENAVKVNYEDYH